MSLNLSSASLRVLVSLTEKREKLLGELSAVEAKISSALNGAPIDSATPKGLRGGATGNTGSAKSSKRSGKRGAVKELVLAGLKEAGEAGIAVKHLAAKLAIKPQNLHVWFHTTGKKSGLVEAAGKGVYRLKQAVGLDTLGEELKVPKSKVVGKKISKAASKKGSSKR